MRPDQIDNPFRSIIQFVELKVARGGKVLESFKELETLLRSSKEKNQVADSRVKKLISFVEDNYSKSEINSANYLIQGRIIEELYTVKDD